MKKIVIIENDENFGSSVKAHLTRLGYSVEHVNRPCAVSSSIRMLKPDLVITGQLVPGTNGMNLPFALRQLTNEQPEFKLVLLSAACSEVRSELVDSGLVDGCLDRAMPIDQLGDAIDSFWSA